MLDQPAVERAPTLVSAAQVHAEFENLLKDRSHMGIRNFLGDVFLDPRNPFEQARRQPKKWVAVIGGLFLLALLIVYSFHFL